MDQTTAQPLVDPKMPESMQAYFQRLRKELDSETYTKVDSITEDGLYIGKRAIRGAQGQGDLLNQAGTVLYHTVVYLRTNGKTSALDYGPHGSADITSNVMEAVPCAPVLHPTATPDEGFPLVKINGQHLDLEDEMVKEALKFAEARKYHAVNNNCIQNTDFFTRVLTQGRVRNAPTIYDAVAGRVPEQDHPMLLMFFLMTRLSWFHVCDGSKLTEDFLVEKGIISRPQPATPHPLDAPKPAAQDRLEEKQIDLMQLIGSLQNGAGSSGGPKPAMP